MHDTVRFQPYNPAWKRVFAANPPLEGTVIDILKHYYLIRFPYKAVCTVVKSNPTLVRCRAAS
jgi:hypothetical protein